MQTNTDFTWMLLVFAGLLAYYGGGALGEVPLVWAAGMLFQIPYALSTLAGSAFPLFAPLFILSFLFYFSTIIKGSVGEGFQMFILASFVILILHI